MSTLQEGLASSSTGARQRFTAAAVVGLRKQSGSALMLVLLFLALMSCLLALLLETTQLEKKTAHSRSASYQAILASESGLTTALTQLSLVAQQGTTFLVGQTNRATSSPILLVGATNLTNPQQLMPLISGTLTSLAAYPSLTSECVLHYLQDCDPSALSATVDLNKKGHPIAGEGCYHAPWVTLTNSVGHPIARYAYILLDEQARVNPALHQGAPRTDPDNWNSGVASLPLFLGSTLLLSKEEATKAMIQAIPSPSFPNLKNVFANKEAYDAKKLFLSHAKTLLPDFIPLTLPGGGKPKYDLNDIATNPIYGSSKSDRALTIASLIDYHLPHFKERDPSLLNTSPEDQKRYLNRLAAGIVDYINTDFIPTLINEGEPAGCNLTPWVTQTAERIRLQSRNSNSVTLENQYFVQVWNPYTKTIPAGATATFFLYNRQCLLFGTAPADPFHDYRESIFNTPLIRPNESVVLAFPTVTQTWSAATPVPVSEHPHWLRGPESNFDPKHHQAFEFRWKEHLVTMSRRLPIGPGLAEGGLDHEAQSLTTYENYWQCNFIPTEEDHANHFRFVGDPRENYLSNYLWKSYSEDKSYVLKTRWKGIMSDASTERCFQPSISWAARDFIPINPPVGNHPLSLAMSPDQVPSPYEEERDAIMAPFVLRNGPMNSIVELGNINDPAQADDTGAAPYAGSSEHQTSIYASGGGRTLHIGQPEFSYPHNNWNVPGKRAIELLDLFTVIATNNNTVFKGSDQELLRTGLININTAPHPIMTALFYGITPTSDRRFTNATLSLATAEKLGTFLEEHRPYEKLSDLEIITPLLAKATTYTPSLSTNVLSGEIPLAAVFDRARQEGFAKIIHLCTVQSRSFRAYILGQSLNTHGEVTGETMIEATLALVPSQKKNASASALVPAVQEKRWIR